MKKDLHERALSLKRFTELPGTNREELESAKIKFEFMKTSIETIKDYEVLFRFFAYAFIFEKIFISGFIIP